MPQPDCVGAAPVRQAPILAPFVIVSTSRAAPFSPFVGRRYVQPALTRNCPVPVQVGGSQGRDGQLTDALWRFAGSGGVGLRRPSRRGWGFFSAAYVGISSARREKPLQCELSGGQTRHLNLCSPLSCLRLRLVGSGAGALVRAQPRGHTPASPRCQRSLGASNCLPRPAETTICASWQRQPRRGRRVPLRRRHPRGRPATPPAPPRGYCGG
jgi:hypothetical protein